MTKALLTMKKCDLSSFDSHTQSESDPSLISSSPSSAILPPLQILRLNPLCFCSCCFMLLLSFYKLSKGIIESKWMFQTTINLYYDQSNCLLCSTIKFGTSMRKAGKKEWQLGTESLNNHARYVNCRHRYNMLQKYSNITSNTVALKIVVANRLE